MTKAKTYCNSTDCSFKPVKFNTFEYMYCSICKSEVTEDMVEWKARQKAYKESHPHMKRHDEEDDQMDMFDFWSSTN